MKSKFHNSEDVNRSRPGFHWAWVYDEKGKQVLVEVRDVDIPDQNTRLDDGRAFRRGADVNQTKRSR